MPVAHVASQPKPLQPKITWSRSKGSLYGAQHAPELDDVRQGNLGDCYFLAPLAAIANTPAGKKILMTILQPVHPGLFSVTFCNIDKHNAVYLNRQEDTEIVDCWFPITDALTLEQECFLYCPAKPLHDTSIPSWSAILEKAYARWDPQGYSGLDNQVCSQAIAHLTGLEPLSLHWDPESKQQADIAWNKGTFSFELEEDRTIKNKGKVVLPNAIPESLLQILLLARENSDCILVAGSLRKSGKDTDFLDQEYKIKDSHQYVILEVSKEGFLVLWEPKAGRVEKPLPITRFITLFNDVLTVDCSASLFFKG